MTPTDTGIQAFQFRFLADGGPTAVLQNIVSVAAHHRYLPNARGAFANEGPS